MADPTYDKLLELAAEAYHESARSTYGRDPKDTWKHAWFVNQSRVILDAIWPEIEKIRQEGFLDGYATGLGNPLGRMDEHGRPT